MNEKRGEHGGLDEPAHYEIRIDGHIDAEWAEWFEGLTVTTHPDGTTLLSGLLADQAALHGLLGKVGSLGMTLITINVARTNNGA